MVPGLRDGVMYKADMPLSAQSLELPSQVESSSASKQTESLLCICCQPLLPPVLWPTLPKLSAQQFPLLLVVKTQPLVVHVHWNKAVVRQVTLT